MKMFCSPKKCHLLRMKNEAFEGSVRTESLEKLPSLSIHLFFSDDINTD